MTQEALRLIACLYGKPVLTCETGLGDSRDSKGITTLDDAQRLTGAWADRTTLTGTDVNRWLMGLRPQNGARSAQRRRGETRLTKLGIEQRYKDHVSIVWATPGFEYPGAVTFRSLRGDGSEVRAEPRWQQAMTERSLEDLLRQVVMEMQRGTIDPADVGVEPITSSGSLPKFAVHRSPADGAWYMPSMDRLSTHIVKHEDRGRLPGEAAAESVCQRTLRQMNIRAARTQAAVMAGQQVVISERGDRHWDPDSARIEPVHQEEWACACGLDPDNILQQPGAPGGWRELFAFLREREAGTEAEIDHLWTSLATTMLIGHRDLHRRNVGIRYARRGEPEGCELAPWYDVSSAHGEGGQIWCAMGMLLGGTDNVKAITEKHWVHQAQECDEDPDKVLGIVADVASQLPDAVREAISEAQSQDEWKHRQECRTRVEAVLTGTARRCSNARVSTRTTVLTIKKPQWVHPVVEAIKAGKRIELKANPVTPEVEIIVKEKDGAGRSAGHASSISNYVNTLRRAKAVNPDEIPFMERTLERERQAKIRREKTHDR